MSAKFIPAQITTRVVEVEASKVAIELTPKEAAHLRALLGKTTGASLYQLYEDLCGLASAGHIESLSLKDQDDRDALNEDTVKPD